jgi:hypothetical protein
MGSRARIIGQVTDAYGDEWDIKAEIDSGHGWPIRVGWPSGYPRGRGGIGGPRVVLTEDLVNHLESVRHDLRPMEAAKLPLGQAQLKRLRKLLGHNRKSDRRAWYEDHIEELATLEHTEFARRYGLSDSAVALMHQELIGRQRGRPDSWWRGDDAKAVLSSDLPIVIIAERLGRSIKAVWTARYLLGITREYRRRI